MVITEDGHAVAFCVVWPDEVNQVGLLEPVGVHPDFHRQGLGRAVVSEGLRRLQACGTVSEIVCGLGSLPKASFLC
jgi:mycothiol synthase